MDRKKTVGFFDDFAKQKSFVESPIKTQNSSKMLLDSVSKSWYSDESDEEINDEYFFPRSSSMARVKRDEIYHVNQKSKTDSVGSIDEPISESFIKKLIQYDTEQFMLRVPFERAQYHQCIPNPYLEGELITV